MTTNYLGTDRGALGAQGPQGGFRLGSFAASATDTVREKNQSLWRWVAKCPQMFSVSSADIFVTDPHHNSYYCFSAMTQTKTYMKQHILLLLSRCHKKTTQELTSLPLVNICDKQTQHVCFQSFCINNCYQNETSDSKFRSNSSLKLYNHPVTCFPEVPEPSSTTDLK